MCNYQGKCSLKIVCNCLHENTVNHVFNFDYFLGSISNNKSVAMCKYQGKLMIKFVIMTTSVQQT